MPPVIRQVVADAQAIYARYPSRMPSDEALGALGFSAKTRAYPGNVAVTVIGMKRPVRLPMLQVLFNKFRLRYCISVTEPAFDEPWVVLPVRNGDNERLVLELKEALDNVVLASGQERAKYMAVTKALIPRIIFGVMLPSSGKLVWRAQRIVRAFERGQKRSWDESIHRLGVAIQKFTYAETNTEAAKWHNVVRKTLRVVKPKAKQWNVENYDRDTLWAAQNVADLAPRNVMRKRTMLEALPRWTTHNYRTVQNMKRGTVNPNKHDPAKFLYYKKLEAVMDAYFAQHALRAPHMPPGVFVNGRQKYLYRGMHPSPHLDVKKALQDGYIEERGFMAFSRDPDIAAGFANRNVRRGIFVRIDPFVDVPRGTPWLWFHKRTLNSWVRSTIPKEAEVLLPPGRLVFKPFTAVRTNDMRWTEIEASFIPDARYMQKHRRPNKRKYVTMARS